MEYKDALFRFEIADQLLGFLDTDLSGKELLDIGCGSGNMLLAATHRGAKECIGVDIDLKNLGDNHFLEIAQQNNINITNIRRFEVRIENVNFADNSFDIITLIDSIEHMDNPEIILKEISRLLKPEGLFLLNVSPLYYSPLGHHLFIYFPKEDYPWVHLYKNFNDLIKEKNVEEWYLDHLKGLNKITSSKILEYSEKYGLRVLKCQIVEVGRDIFSQFSEKIDPDLQPSSFDDFFIESNTILFTK